MFSLKKKHHLSITCILTQSILKQINTLSIMTPTSYFNIMYTILEKLS